MQARLQQQSHSQSSDSQESDSLYQDNLTFAELSAQHESIYGETHRQQHEDQQDGLLAENPRQVYSAGLAGHSPPSSLGQLSTTQVRSIPIAIVRPSGEKSNEPTGFETDEDDDSEVDIVERDAMRLRRKFGDKVIVSDAASYESGLTNEVATATNDSSKFDNSMLKAPYLGSLSKSENFLMSLPPINLSGQRVNYEDGDPPVEVTSYGSLRESQQRGKFLDGPSSYREPRSGQIRRLDHRARPGAGLSQSHQQTVSIGERIAQAQRKKERENKKDDSKLLDEGGTSRLSLMMDEASKKAGSQLHEESSDSTSSLVPSVAILASNQFNAFDEEQELEAYDKFDPPNMMSTSLTAFEVLSASSQAMAGYQRNHTHRFVRQQQQQLQTSMCNASAFDSNSASSMPHSGLPSEAEIRGQNFQPLSRSLSDPTPHYLQRSPVMSPSMQQSLLGGIRTDDHSGLYWPNTYNLMAGMDPAAAAAAAAVHIPTMAPNQLIDPDREEAFDMDME